MGIQQGPSHNAGRGFVRRDATHVGVWILGLNLRRPAGTRHIEADDTKRRLCIFVFTCAIWEPADRAESVSSVFQYIDVLQALSPQINKKK